MSTVLEGVSRQHASDGSGDRRPVVVAGWHERARGLGLHERLSPDLGSVCKAELNRLADQHQPLCSHAVPIMEVLHRQIRNSHSMVILTESSGLILHALGDADFREKADSVALRPGVAWSEASKGTNAIGTALADGRATVVHGIEHFLTANRFLTCSCSPIRDPIGRVIGALDVSATKEQYHAHTMALVRISTQMIENKLFVDQPNQFVRVHFHLRTEFLGTLEEGMIAFDESGRFIAANRAARAQLGLAREALPSHTLSSLFGITVDSLIDQCGSNATDRLTLCLHNGSSVGALAHLCKPAARARTTAPYPKDSDADDGSAVAQPMRARGGHTLEQLKMGEPTMARVIERIRKVQKRDIPVMIVGETGTGKEVLARAIHGDSMRRSKPFVAVDCASIPEALIEAELFGYQEGAFTGARRKGCSGKILAANGGTLFLDEIGDMPLCMQTRLLRALQERAVTPLGGSKAIPVDIAVICATHRNLHEMIQRGEFRLDLYYRLNGLVVRLPPLRERCDLRILVEHILASSCASGTPPKICDEAFALFRCYPWPGNIRQLMNVLSTAAAMAADDGNTIRIEHLPDDFLEELRRAGLLPEGVLAEHRAAQFRSPGTLETPRAPVPDGRAAPGQTAPKVLKDIRISAIRAALDRHSGNITATARDLEISRNTIYRALRAHS